MLAGLAILAALLIVALLVRWEVYVNEGVHLGPRVTGWLYDHWARQYDQDKAQSQAGDARFLARPLLAACDMPAPLLLDVATGTGRLPLALLREPAFLGHVIALDISRGMLETAAGKLGAYKGRVEFVQHPAAPLPFADGRFDVAACLEALELMPEMQPPLAELARVLRPGGLLLTSRGGVKLDLPDKIKPAAEFERLLLGAGFEQVREEPWHTGRYDFVRVWARKPGAATGGDARGSRALCDVLRCPACGAAGMDAALRCPQCGARVPLSPEGIALMM